MRAIGLVEAQGDAMVDVADAPHQAAGGHELAGALEERLAGQQQREDRPEAELVRGRLGAAEGGDDLGGGEDRGARRRRW
jgi:hypothetical protein